MCSQGQSAVIVWGNGTKDKIWWDGLCAEARCSIKPEQLLSARLGRTQWLLHSHVCASMQSGSVPLEPALP
eukprot:3332116-Amphidinium_carterae.1